MTKTAMIFAALIAAASGAANADPRDDALTAMQRCSTLGDRDKRLDCFDAAIARVPATASVDAAPTAPVTASAPPPRPRTGGFLSAIFGDGMSRDPQTTAAAFGSESITNGGQHASPIAIHGDTINQIGARLAAASFASGYITVTLDNGQIWRQTANADSIGKLNKPASGYVAIITRGNFDGSYAMRLSGIARMVPVRRIH